MNMSIMGINWLKGKEDKVLDKQGNHIIYDDRTGKPVRFFRAFPIIGRGSVIHDWVSHEEVERRFERARHISMWTKLRWLLGGYAWW